MNAVKRALEEDRRWFVLDAVAQMETRTLNEQLILRMIHGMGRPVNAEDLRNDLLLLERSSCLGIEKLSRPTGGELWVVTLTTEGLEVRDCVRVVHGVASRKPL